MTITNLKRKGFKIARRILRHPVIKARLEKYLIRSGIRIARLIDKYLQLRK